jgi:D-tyrosyl-tRNA(Tyr) deacylase
MDSQRLVSQFTLLANVKKGNKPDFHQSASGDKARALYQSFFKKVGQLHGSEKVKDGVFAAMMDVALINDGPVSLEHLLSRWRKRLQLCNLSHHS